MLVSKRMAVAATVAALSLLGTEPPMAAAQDAQNAKPAATETDEPAPLTLDELEVLVAPIALYPDELVALCISASLHPLQIVQAARFLEAKKKKSDLKPDEKWDGSVISLLNYPEVVKKMNDDLQWTEQLGKAAVNQQKDLLVAIQQLRDQAVAKDILKSDAHVKVVEEGDNVVISPVDPETVYVPTYPPEMLYEPNYVVPAEPITYESYPSYYYPTAPYWAGLVTGAAFAAVVDWDNWGTWGGDLDIDVDGGNFDFNKIDIDKIDRDKLNNLDFRNIDRSKINISNANIDRNKLTQNLKSKDFNNIAARGRNEGGTGRSFENARAEARASDLKGKDVRKSVSEGLKQQQRSTARSATPGGKRAAAGQTSQQRKASTQRANRPAAQRNASARPTSQKVANKNVSRKKPAGRVDNRTRRPSAIGHPGHGRVASNHSNRGFQSRGGGFRGGGGRGGGRGGGGGGRR